MKLSVRIAMFTFLAALTVGQSAQASLLVEPYLGYVSGKGKQFGDVNLSGTELGLRFGYSSMMGLALGAEYEALSLKDDSSPSNDYKAGDLGVFVAFKFPVLVRAYLTYIPSPQFSTNVNGTDTKFKSGNIVKLGVGYTGLPFINLNFEIISGTYGKAEAGGNESDMDPKFTTSMYAISISAPFNFL